MAETGAIVETEARRAETSHASLVEATGAMRLAALAANQAVVRRRRVRRGGKLRGGANEDRRRLHGRVRRGGG